MRTAILSGGNMHTAILSGGNMHTVILSGGNMHTVILCGVQASIKICVNTNLISRHSCLFFFYFHNRN